MSPSMIALGTSTSARRARCPLEMDRCLSGARNTSEIERHFVEPSLGVSLRGSHPSADRTGRILRHVPTRHSEGPEVWRILWLDIAGVELS